MSANGSRADCLYHVADKIAIGNVDFDIGCKYELIKLQAEDIMKDLIAPDSWNMQVQDGTTPILAGLEPSNILTKERHIQSGASHPKSTKMD